MAVLALSSWAAKQGNGFATDEVTGAIIGIGDYRRALVQAGAAVLGIVIALLLSCVDYRSLVKVWPVHVVLTWGLVLPTLVIRNVTIGPLTIGYNAGDTDNYSWYKLGGFTFQPTELAKISFILTFAMHLNNVRSRINEPKELAKLLLHLLVPIAIIHVQGDDGTAIIYAIIGCCMMFAAGLSWKYILGAVSAAAVAMATAFAFFSDKIGKGYQWYRILAVIDPENSTGWAPNEATWKNIIYQQQRGEIALGSGGIFGNGLFGGRYYSVPNAHNDFILSWIGNVAGFVGCCVVLGVLLALVIKTFSTGARSEDLLGSYICAGIGGALMAQIAVNVGMNLRVLPVSTKQVVLSRYATFGIMASATAVISLVYLLVLNTPMQEILSVLLMTVVLNVYFAAVMIPVAYKWGIQKGRLIFMLVLGVSSGLFVAGAFILNRQVSVVATASFYKMVLLGIAGLFLLLVLGLLLSIHLSVKIVSKKEL